MDKVIYYNDLYDLYGSLLTKRQQEYFQDYYFNNLSFSEMASNYGVSRNAVFKQVHIVLDKLEEYESKLGLFNKKKIILDISNKIKDDNLKDVLQNLF